MEFWNFHETLPFCFKKVIQIAPGGHFPTSGSQKLIFKALQGLAKTYKVFLSKHNVQKTIKRNGILVGKYDYPLFLWKSYIVLHVCFKT